MINDFINKTNHAAVIAVTQAEGWSAPNAPFPPSLPPFLPSPSLSFQYCLPLPTTRQRQGEKGMEQGVYGGWGGGGLVMRERREWRGRGGRKKSENPFWNPFSIRGPQAVITGVPEWGPVSENVSYPFLKWNLIWEAQRWRGQRICKLLSIPTVNGNFISVRWHSPLFTVDHLNGCLKRRWPLTLPLSLPALCITLPSLPIRRFFYFFSNTVKCFFFFFKHFSHALHLLRDFSGNLHENQTFVAL